MTDSTVVLIDELCCATRDGQMAGCDIFKKMPSFPEKSCKYGSWCNVKEKWSSETDSKGGKIDKCESKRWFRRWWSLVRLKTTNASSCQRGQSKKVVNKINFFFNVILFKIACLKSFIEAPMYFQMTDIFTVDKEKMTWKETLNHQLYKWQRCSHHYLSHSLEFTTSSFKLSY